MSRNKLKSLVILVFGASIILVFQIVSQVVAAELKGKVIDSTGQPLGNKTIYISCQYPISGHGNIEGKNVAKIISDEKGRFSVDLPDPLPKCGENFFLGQNEGLKGVSWDENFNPSYFPRQSQYDEPLVIKFTESANITINVKQSFWDKNNIKGNKVSTIMKVKSKDDIFVRFYAGTDEFWKELYPNHKGEYVGELLAGEYDLFVNVLPIFKDPQDGRLYPHQKSARKVIVAENIELKPKENKVINVE